MRIANAPVFSADSMATSLTSPIFNVHEIFGYSIQLYWTGSPVGNFTIEASNDQGQQLADGSITGVTNFTTISGSSSAAGGASGNLMYNADLSFYRWVRVVYARSSGSGTVDGRINPKGV